ncbi:MAG TPA: thiamine phosphate synthase, partial [Candidatus Methylomirabilis sp.]|nr:thiamine phosphate synthase [Candidatus Methylomirabilis sp.]
MPASSSSQSFTPRLCYITARRALGARALLPLVEQAVRAGIDLIQVREKDLETRPLVALVQSILDRARGTSTRVVVNDRLDIALALGADGVHLGRQSIPARAVRRSVPREFVIGVSCHSVDEARDAEASGANYIVFGPV